MKEQQEQENKKNDRKIYMRFLIFVLLSGIVGYFVGMAIRILQATAGTSISSLLDTAGRAMIYIVPMLYLLMHLTAATISFSIYGKAKKKAAHWDGEDEEYIESVEASLDIPVIMGNVIMVLNLLLYTVVIYQADHMEMSQLWQNILTNGGTVLMILGYIYEMAVQKLVVDLEKKLNPEKRGNVFEIDFMKTWMKSCDEAQKWNHYEAAYHAFRITNLVCLVLWLLCFIAQFAFQAGLLPVFCVSGIWLVLVLSYSISAYRLEHGKNSSFSKVTKEM